MYPQDGKETSNLVYNVVIIIMGISDRVCQTPTIPLYFAFGKYPTRTKFVNLRKYYRFYYQSVPEINRQRLLALIEAPHLPLGTATFCALMYCSVSWEALTINTVGGFKPVPSWITV